MARQTQVATGYLCSDGIVEEAQAVVTEIYIPEKLQVELLAMINKKLRTGIIVKKVATTSVAPRARLKRPKKVGRTFETTY